MYNYRSDTWQSSPPPHAPIVYKNTIPLESSKMNP